MIIDEEESFTQLVKLNLEASGKYEVRAGNEGSLGLIAAKQFKPDLILLDLIMPDMGGGELSYQLRSDEDTKTIPIFIGFFWRLPCA
ncbi:MAG: response regulator [Proteobacteria bacterium]|nr:response regulator [Pseudomonadota bacterium]